MPLAGLYSSDIRVCVFPVGTYSFERIEVPASDFGGNIFYRPYSLRDGLTRSKQFLHMFPLENSW